jgi:outer membrane protein OmpA-like peptidoglycan-associated protein
MVRIPIAYKKIKDRDSDKVSDRKDQCVKVPGTWEYRGCPDRDGDHIRDEEDDCPDVPGLAALHGCPDKDGDGVTDLKDDCPDEIGLAIFNGCVYSYVSAVETKTAKFKLEGYNTDTLKTVFVTAPNLRGKNAYREADGFFRFAKEAEVVILKEEEKQVMKKAFENLEYKTNSDVILSTSFSSLDELAKLMEMNSTWKLRISGHTDNVGPREANVGLSKRRSESVKTYLMTKGIASDRFEVLYFGPDNPIAPNNTEDGRARNRRVEMLIVE